MLELINCSTADRDIGHLHTDRSRLKVGGIAIADRSSDVTWALVEEISGTAVYVRAIEADDRTSEDHEHTTARISRVTCGNAEMTRQGRVTTGPGC